MQRQDVQRHAETILRAVAQETCPACPRCQSDAEREVVQGLRDALVPHCAPCQDADEELEKGREAAAARLVPLHTRGTVASRAVATLVSEDFASDQLSFTLYELRRDGARNECDYKVFLDEEHRTRPLVMEKQPCAADGGTMQVIGKPFRVHDPHAVRYRPDIPAESGGGGAGGPAAQ